MLDFAQRSAVTAVASAIPGDQARPDQRGAEAPSSFGLRALVGRLAGAREAPAGANPAPAPAPDPAARRGVRLSLAAGAEETADAPADKGDPTLRAQAHAAFRTVDGAADRALDAAMTVMETEITQLRTAVRTYGEALKSIQTYAAEEAIRALARAALRDRPQRLAAALPVPHLPVEGPFPERRRHG